MRRTTSALSTAILGAALTASMVSAQQLRESDRAARTASDDSSSTDSAQSTLYGMTAARGARYLLRNGLDYLNYQQYERALKFLRDAETRQKELNDAEKRALKKGIERAQRGLREAAEADVPYALSERSRRRNGFTAAKPDIQVANNPNPIDQSARRSVQSADTKKIGTDPDVQGEPIRLTSADDSSTQAQAPAVATDPTPTAKTSIQNPPASRDQTLARQLPSPEIPKLPDFASMPDVSGSRTQRAPNQGAGYEGAAVSGRVTTPTPSAAPQESTGPATAQDRMADRDDQRTPKLPTESHLPIGEDPNTAGTQVTKAAGAVESKLPPTGVKDPAEPAGLPAELTHGPVAQNAPQPAPASSSDSPASQDSPAAQLATAPPAVAPVQSTPTPSQTAEVPPVAASSTPERRLAASGGAEPSTKPAVIELETTTSTTQADQTAKSDESGVLTHRETEEAPPPAVSSPGSGAGPAAVNAPASQPVAAATGDDLPLLPAEVPGTATRNPALAAGPTEVSAPVATSPSPSIADELPPLPAELGQAGANDIRPSSSPTADVSTPATVTPDGESSLRPLPAAAPPSATSTAPTAAPTTMSEAAVPRADAEREPVQSEVQPASPASGSPGSDSNSVSLPPLPEDATAAAAQPDQREPAANPNPVDPISATSAAPGVGVTGESPSSSASGGDQATRESGSDPLLPRRPYPPSTLRPELQREVDRIARLQEEELQRRAISPPQPAPPPDSTSSDLRMQTQQDISRAPSPAEARPIKAIPVPEDWVPLGPRDWIPQRKYWAAAATCHLPLYFQDPVLERYGHSVEQFFGPYGRYLTYPVDDPTQSTQRNQILQPFFSAGLFGLQIIAWPYNLIMDPPWEAQYDLGYYRPGDQIPTDTYWLPLHGYGPPLHGSKY